MSQENIARKPWWRRFFGQRSESAAERYLKRIGCKILSRNYKCKLGELDLVARDGDAIVIVEVRSTGGNDPLRPAQSVDYSKQRRLTRIALAYLKRYQLLDHMIRFDVVTVHWPPHLDKPEIQHFPSAFEACESS